MVPPNLRGHKTIGSSVIDKMAAIDVDNYITAMIIINKKAGAIDIRTACVLAHTCGNRVPTRQPGFRMHLLLLCILKPGFAAGFAPRFCRRGVCCKDKIRRSYQGTRAGLLRVCCVQTQFGTGSSSVKKVGQKNLKGLFVQT
eukprot:1952531-Pyramimonas_sp.AAC.1